MDRIDQIIDALNQAIPAVPFGRDAMEDDTPEDWGAVELAGADHVIADGRVIDTDWRVNVWMCVSERETGLEADVGEVLAELADEWYSRWKCSERAYLYDIDKVMWHWTITVPDPLEIPGTEPDGEPEPEPDPGTDPDSPVEPGGDPGDGITETAPTEPDPGTDPGDDPDPAETPAEEPEVGGDG